MLSSDGRTIRPPRKIWANCARSLARSTTKRPCSKVFEPRRIPSLPRVIVQRRSETLRILVAGGLVVLLAGGFLFYEARAQPGGKAAIVGSITYRYRTAQRRSSSSVV